MEKICLFCEHFVFRTGDMGYSEYTPGYDAEIRCGKGYWKLDLYEDSEDDYRKKQLKAQDCSNFELVNLTALGVKTDESNPIR